MNKTIAAIAITLALAGSAFARTKICQIELDLAPKLIKSNQWFTDDLKHYTDATRPSLEKALSVMIEKENEEMTDVCQAYDEDDALAAYNLHNLATVRAIANFGDAMRAAQRKRKSDWILDAGIGVLALMCSVAVVFGVRGAIIHFRTKT